MTDYIMNGWGNKDLWILDNAEWVETNKLRIKFTGSVYREFTNILNIDWFLTVADGIGHYFPYPGESSGVDIQIFLQDDANSIIFRKYMDIEAKKFCYYIIYDGIVRDEIIIDDPFPRWYNDLYIDKVWRIDSVYYYKIDSGLELSFDYGSIKKPLKLKFVTFEGSEHLYSMWVSLLWYYTNPIDSGGYAFIA